MGYNLFLDDFRKPEDSFNYTYDPRYVKLDWIVVRNYEQFVEYIEKNGIPDRVSFDHDLGDEHYNVQTHINYDEFKEKTGYHCAKWLIEFCIENSIKLNSVIMIHSMNIEGGKNIESLFRTFNKHFLNN